MISGTVRGVRCPFCGIRQNIGVPVQEETALRPICGGCGRMFLVTFRRTRWNLRISGVHPL